MTRQDTQFSAATGAVDPGNPVPPVVAPDARREFAGRAARFEHLANGHPSADYLGFLAALSRVQHELLQRHPAVALPSASALEQARTHGMPPLPANGLQRDAVWRSHLAALVDAMLPAVPQASRDFVAALPALEDTELDRLADAVLRCEYDPQQAARLPFVAAALQVYWTHLASRPELDGLTRLDVAGVCPCCGSLPVASVVHPAERNGARYLHCSLCNTEWNLVRVNCSACGEIDHVSYRVATPLDAEGRQSEPSGDEIVRAEVCDDCKSYLKVVRRDKDAAADPVADDLATLALDMLVDEAGYERSGPNPLFIPGESA